MPHETETGLRPASQVCEAILDHPVHKNFPVDSLDCEEEFLIVVIQ